MVLVLEKCGDGRFQEFFLTAQNLDIDTCFGHFPSYHFW
jgi:hypothetical protein